MDQDFYIEDSSPIKAIIAIIFFIGLIVASIYYFFNYRKENVVKLKDVTVELGELLPTDINTYIVSGNPDSYTIDLSNVSVDETGKTNSTGEYSYRIKKNSNIKKGKIYVKDTTKPEVEVEELTVGVNESFEVSEFVSECKDLSLPCNVKYKNIKDEDLNQKEGSYEVDIIITDSENNSITKSVRLNVSGTNTFAKKKEANLKFDHLSDDDSNWDKTYTLKLEKALNDVDNLKKKTYVAVLLFLGVRNCEACGLEWGDIDFANNKISIRRDSMYIKQMKTYTTTTKNDYSKRTLTIPKKLISILQEYKEWYEQERINWGDRWIDSDRLFIRENGDACNPTSPGKWLAEILLANGMRKVSPHSLRHTNITILLRNGVSAKIVAKWAGHANPAVTLSTYAHFLDEDENVSADCIDNIFSDKKADNE